MFSVYKLGTPIFARKIAFHFMKIILRGSGTLECDLIWFIYKEVFTIRSQRSAHSERNAGRYTTTQPQILEDEKYGKTTRCHLRRKQATHELRPRHHNGVLIRNKQRNHFESQRSSNNDRSRCCRNHSQPIHKGTQSEKHRNRDSRDATARRRDKIQNGFDDRDSTLKTIDLAEPQDTDN